MVRQRAGLGKKIFKGGALDFFKIPRTTEAGIEVILKERTKINFFEWIFFVWSRDWGLFGCGSPVSLFLSAANIINEWHSIFEFFEHRILNHLGGDHVLQLKFVER